MAFDVYHTRNPLLDSLIAMSAGRAQADRQNDLIENQQQFAADQQLAGAITGGTNQGINFAFNRALQDASIQGRSQLENLRQPGAEQLLQQRLDAQYLQEFGITPDQAGQLYPNAGTFSEAVAAHRAQTTAAYSQQMQAAVRQAGLEPYVPADEIIKVNEAVSRAMVDPTLDEKAKFAIIDKANSDLQFAARPRLGPRRSPPTIGERFQGGQAMIAPGYDDMVYYDHRGGLKRETLHPRIDPASFAEGQRPGDVWQHPGGAILTRDDKGNVKKLSDVGGSGGVDMRVVERNMDDALKLISSPTHPMFSEYMGASPERRQEMLVEETLRIGEAKDEVARRMAGSSVETLSSANLTPQQQGVVDAGQAMLDRGVVPPADMFVVGGEYVFHPPDGSEGRRARVIGRGPDDEPIFEWVD